MMMTGMVMMTGMSGMTMTITDDASQYDYIGLDGQLHISSVI